MHTNVQVLPVANYISREHFQQIMKQMSLIGLIIQQILHVSRQYLFTIFCEGPAHCLVRLQLSYQVEVKNPFYMS